MLMASNDEYQQQRTFKERKLVPINGGVDGRKTWKYAGNSTTDILWFNTKSQLECGRDVVPVTIEKLKTK